MTLHDLVDNIKECSLKHKLVYSFEEGDVFEIMNNGDKKYTLVVLTINNVNVNNNKEMIVNCYLYYIDRLTESEDNRLDVWTAGISTLLKIITRLGYNNFEIVTGTNISYQPFREKFQDLCAGVYANIEFTIVSDVTNCDTEIYN